MKTQLELVDHVSHMTVMLLNINEELRGLQGHRARSDLAPGQIATKMIPMNSLRKQKDISIMHARFVDLPNLSMIGMTSSSLLRVISHICNYRRKERRSPLGIKISPR